jgi:CRISPR-associated protein Cst1
MNIALSGNPFVDTGLGVIAALSGLDDVTALTLEKMREVFDDGSQLAAWNSSLPTFTQVFGTNGPLFQKGYGYKKGIGPAERNFAIYRGTLQALLDLIPAMSAMPRGAPCEACAAPNDFDFAHACGRVIEGAQAKAPEEKWVGRDWFPLTGSLGSDAQALPAASRPVHICPRCLFAVHYLPLALISLDGWPAMFQSTSVEFWYELVRDLVVGDGGAESRLKLGHFDTPGTKEGSRAVSRRLLAYFKRVQEANRFGDIDPDTTLLVWRFKNSGASPDCQIDVIPNEALRFLWAAAGSNLGREIESLIAGESKRSGFLHCISERREYPGLYPRGKHTGASPKLFALYQTEVRGRPARVLGVAQSLARRASMKIKAHELLRFQRVESFRAPAVRNRFRRLMSELARQNEFTLSDYLSLFQPNADERGVGVESDGWEIIRYYLHHPDDQDVPAVTSDAVRSVGARTERVAYYAGRVFSSYIAERGIARFESDVLQPAGMGDVGTIWLQRQFTRHAEQFPGFTYAAWEALCLNDAGRSCLSEVLFQMRLLWAEWLSEGNSPSGRIPAIQNESGLAKRVEQALTEMLLGYVQQRGLVRFRRDILMRLQQRMIGLGWLRRQFVERGGRQNGVRISEGEWEESLIDDMGHRAPFTRLFQMHLYLANVYRNIMENNTLIESIGEDAQ